MEAKPLRRHTTSRLSASLTCKEHHRCIRSTLSFLFPWLDSIVTVGRTGDGYTHPRRDQWKVRMGVPASRLQLGNPCCHRNDRFPGLAGLIQCRAALVPRSVFSSSICFTCVHSPNLSIFSLIGVQPGPITLLVMGKTINHWA